MLQKYDGQRNRIGKNFAKADEYQKQNIKKKTIRSKINIIELSFDQISNIKVCSS